MSRIVFTFETADASASASELSRAVAEVLPTGEVVGLSDDALLQHGASLEQLGRQIDARRVEWAAEVGERSRRELGSASLAAKKGCRTAVELIQRVTRTSGATVSRLLKLGAETRPQRSLAGVEFPARFPRVSEALNNGDIGADTARAIVNGLAPSLDHIAIDDLAVAEFELVASAMGTSPESTVPATADEITVQATQWRAFLDPDGVRPTEERAMAERSFSRGVTKGGLVIGTYALLPEIAGKLNRVMDSYLSPKTTGTFLSDEDREAAEAAEAEGGRDPRTDVQKRHDVFASMIDAVARSGETPSIGGAAPTVLVSVTSDDLSRGRGVGWIDGVDDPISFDAVKQFICTGGTQNIRFDSDGRIIELGSPQRCFTPAQRKAITLRDGGCIIPGCNIPPDWTEIHHVIADADGGPTHTDNGVLLCWYHHRSIESSGWQVRMRKGVPEVKAPPWIQWDAPWRPASKSRTRYKPPRTTPTE
ncbi:HNH endonuclease signature motif containing protein [Homoserinimonas sp. A447]